MCTPCHFRGIIACADTIWRNNAIRTPTRLKEGIYKEDYPFYKVIKLSMSDNMNLWRKHNSFFVSFRPSLSDNGGLQPPVNVIIILKSLK